MTRNLIENRSVIGWTAVGVTEAMPAWNSAASAHHTLRLYHIDQFQNKVQQFSLIASSHSHLAIYEYINSTLFKEVNNYTVKS